MTAKNNDAVKKRRQKEKEELIEQLKKCGIIQIACQKVGIGRATFYRWKSEDEEFAEMADSAVKEGVALITDMAESQLISAIRDRNMTAIIFWLKAHHGDYKSKVELSGKVEIDNKPLSEEQKELIAQALKLAGLDSGGKKYEQFGEQQ